MTSPKIAIIGPGSIGCYFGGLMALAGYDVLFFGRESRITALQNHGLTIKWSDHEDHIAVHATSDPTQLHDRTHIFIAVKTPQTMEVAKAIKDVVALNAIVVSLQNGLDNTKRLRTEISNPCLSAMIYAATAMTGPAEVSHFGGGSLIIGDETASLSGDALQALATFLEAAQIPTTISSDIQKDIWGKFVVNCVINGVSAIGQICYQDMANTPGFTLLANRILVECMAIADREGVHLSLEELQERIANVPVAWPHQKSSTAQDLAYHRFTEIDHLNGYVYHRGLELHLPTPMNHLIYTTIKMLEKTQVIDHIKNDANEPEPRSLE